MSMASEGRSWYTYITIDLLATVLSRSIFHPFIACLIPLCLEALGFSHDHPHVIATFGWACFLFLLIPVRYLNGLVGYGSPRKLDWTEEVVVITGGGNGLGRVIAEMYGMKGASVAVLDIRIPGEDELIESEALSNVHFYQCDVGDPQSIARARQEIETDLGTVTVLINNAGLVNGRPLLDLTPEQLTRNFTVNLVSHFHTIRTFLPGMLSSPTGGTIVTVSSVLGKLGASHLSDYTAAKAGLIAMHTSLQAELRSARTAPDGAVKIRMLLVTPGQLSTTLFAGVVTPSNFIGPVVEPVELAREIVKSIDSGMSGAISMPLYACCMDWMNVLPVGMQRVARWASGVDRAMEDSVSDVLRQEAAADRPKTN